MCREQVRRGADGVARDRVWWALGWGLRQEGRSSLSCCLDLPGYVLAAPLAALMLWFRMMGCQGAALLAQLAVCQSWLLCDCRAGFLVRVGSVGFVQTSVQVPKEFLPWLTGRRCLIQPATCQYEFNLQK